MIKCYRLCVVDKKGYFVGLISCRFKSSVRARESLLSRAKKYGKPYGVMFYG